MTIQSALHPSTPAAGAAEARTLRILLAEDHPVVRHGVKALIAEENDMAVVAEAANGPDAVEQAAAIQPDIVIMDISLEGASGLQATGQIRERCPDARILALTVHEQRSYLRQMLSAGAAGYVLKRSAPEELIRAIRSVASGETYIDRAFARTDGDGVIREPAAARDTTLSDRETEVVRLISEGYTNKEIATRLAISVKTVETYKARSMDKLGFRSRADIVRYALLQGWLQA